ncbi:4-(cytidine 5'-diphospho)-2-C-methyl-D-erythritol kinase [Idiomarina abyssalis]|jgi:4-diphosphocytidyl-2-C-methyl-D-erythritol kinase|uniref:4-(cytidine 5'-diphospho)-2-C-methyl-D-erythritol kinase n=1 Tax=Idiomarina abyssalis TaxID=86102 RepID=UPI0023006B37|nr:4-(cytidine 5'-diphospho)-2-C-methyl-D-erythritol kinase [Idiomarina abyssalis]MDA6066357.1 4-(cytidine 5'-diphospho)-2-C-methyl-D-erythritol kinase [Idiomarina abyssalis]|tara:strand:+ start:2061 stop:2924 length:864 start_codon:yes stop_codon:yes gene_type:complete
MAVTTLTLPAPAKLNLFLHITGRRPDGYHNLQTVFQFLDYGDTLKFHTDKTDGQFRLIDNSSQIPEQENLVWKAQAALKQAYKEKGIEQLPGCTIELIKHLPQGAGLGGGSSNAATALVGLNRLWGSHFSSSELQKIGGKLGADVPVFIHGQACFAEGIGDIFTDVSPPELWYLVVKPEVSISTAELFSHPQLKRDCAVVSAQNWDTQNVTNVFEPVVCDLHTEVAMLRRALLEYAPTRLTGSGACLFSSFETRQAAKEAQQHVPKGLRSFIAQGQNRSPLIQTLTQ